MRNKKYNRIIHKTIRKIDKQLTKARLKTTKDEEKELFEKLIIMIDDYISKKGFISFRKWNSFEITIDMFESEEIENE